MAEGLPSDVLKVSQFAFLTNSIGSRTLATLAQKSWLALVNDGWRSEALQEHTKCKVHIPVLARWTRPAAAGQKGHGKWVELSV